MTALLDASALVALIADEPGGIEVAELLGEGGGSCSAVNVAEVLDWVIRIGKAASTEARDAIRAVAAAGLVVVPCDESIAFLAGELRARWYDRRSAPLSLADCIAAATAIVSGATLVSSDAVLCRTAKRSGAEVHPIRNSVGRRPDV